MQACLSVHLKILCTFSLSHNQEVQGPWAVPVPTLLFLSSPSALQDLSRSGGWPGAVGSLLPRALCFVRLSPLAARISNQSVLKEISPEYSLKGLMLKLKLQYFGHVMGRADSLEKPLMLGKIEGRRRRG